MTFSDAAIFALPDGFASVAVASLGTSSALDVVGVSRSGAVEVWMGDGSGGFTSAATYSAGSASGVSVADLGGNGHQDLIVCDRGTLASWQSTLSGQGISVLTNTGQGKFGLSTSYAFGLGSYHLVTADLLGDGTPDVIVQDPQNGVDILYGQPSGTLSAPVPLAFSPNTVAVAAATLHGDALPDVVAVTSDGTVGIARNLGHGSFAPYVTMTAGKAVNAIAVADLAGDGVPDILLADASIGLIVLPGAAGGGFGPPTYYATGLNAVDLKVADLNGDGVPDVVLAQGDNVVVLLGNGSGGFARPSYFAAGGFVNAIAIGDLHGDGSPDIITANASGGISVLSNTTQVACFVAGSHIMTNKGARPVETLRAGDRVLSHRRRAFVPIRWVGERHIDLTQTAEPSQAAPVRIRAGAFGRGMPLADLLLSPEHAVLVEAVLIPIRCLIDGVMVCQERPHDVWYHHIETDGHDVVVAEGLPVETWRDTGNRWMFSRVAHLAGATSANPVAPCVPVVETGPALDRALQRLSRAAPPRVPGRAITRRSG